MPDEILIDTNLANNLILIKQNINNLGKSFYNINIDDNSTILTAMDEMLQLNAELLNLIENVKNIYP